MSYSSVLWTVSSIRILIVNIRIDSVTTGLVSSSHCLIYTTHLPFPHPTRSNLNLFGQEDWAYRLVAQFSCTLICSSNVRLGAWPCASVCLVKCGRMNTSSHNVHFFYCTNKSVDLASETHFTSLAFSLNKHLVCKALDRFDVCSFWILWINDSVFIFCSFSPLKSFFEFLW